jgi:hypothetical protein
MARSLAVDASRPLTDEEKKAADRDAPPGQRVYAPASERVPVDPVPGHREVVEHTDTHTTEREAAGMTSTTTNVEPSFTRVARPSTMQNGESSSNPDFPDMPGRRRRMFFGIGFSWFTVICCGAAAWFFMRWKRERDKPINRLRRQAKQAATELRGRVPRAEDAAKPAMGVTTAVLSILLLLWQQAQSQSRSRTADKMVSRR